MMLTLFRRRVAIFEVKEFYVQIDAACRIVLSTSIYKRDIQCIGVQSTEAGRGKGIPVPAHEIIGLESAVQGTLVHINYVDVADYFMCLLRMDIYISFLFFFN